MDTREEFKRFKVQISDIQRKLDKVERMAKNCDPRILDEMTGINNFLEKNRRFKDTREYIVITTDVNLIKTDIIDHCICPRRT